jgi:endonuclease/exonuclease/phosphatase (EEP) superfamily protein YafD
MNEVLVEEEGAPDGVPTKLPLWRRFLHGVALVLASFGVALYGLRVIFRDWMVGTEVLFWVPFWAWIPLLVVPCLLVYGWGKRLLLLGLVGVLSIPSIILEQPLLFSAARKSASTPPDAHTLVVWNVMMYNRGKRLVLEGFEEVDPDLLLFVEGTTRGAAPDFITRGLSPEYVWSSTRQMALGSKWTIRKSEELKTHTSLRVFRSEVEHEGQSLTLMLVDMPSPPRWDTRAIFQELEEVLLAEESANVIVVGDMNTPRGSWWMRRVFRDWRDAYLTADQRPGGWLASFPDTFPMVQIDHAFVRGDIALHRAELLAGHASDHYRQVLEFSVVSTKKGSPSP